MLANSFYLDCDYHFHWSNDDKLWWFLFDYPPKFLRIRSSWPVYHAITKHYKNSNRVLLHIVWMALITLHLTVYPKKYAHGFVVLCFVVVMQSFIMNSHEVFIHIHQGCFAGTGAIVRLPQCQWSKPDGYGKISQCITTTKHSKAVTVCIFLGTYCTCHVHLLRH